jgi:hypothetical protein
MSRRAQVNLDWADDTYSFRLRIKELIELDELCDAGPAHMHQACLSGTWRVKHVRETIRLGLIGGGMTPRDALNLVRKYVDERPLTESVLVAEAVLMAAIIGVPEDEAPKKPEPEAETESLSQGGE